MPRKGKTANPNYATEPNPQDVLAQVAASGPLSLTSSTAVRKATCILRAVSSNVF